MYLTQGWLHISSTTESFAPTSSTFPDGSPIPTKWTDELWILLDNKGNAIKAITLQDTGDPTTSQVSVFEKGVWTNVTLGFSMPPEEYKPRLDNGFFSSTVPYKSSILLDRYNDIVDSRDVVVFVVTEKLKNPVKLLKDTKDKKSKEINGSVYKYYFFLILACLHK